jgi:hypothetical protein
MKLDDDEKRLIKVPYAPNIQITLVICNLILQPIMFYIIWDIISKGEIPIFFPIMSLFLFGMQYLFYRCEYVITNRRVIIDDGANHVRSLKLGDLKRIKIQSCDGLGGSNYRSIEFAAKTERVTWIWVKYSESLRQQLENITSIKVES